jgi:hypothetical protein
LTRKQRAQEYTFPDQKAPEYRQKGTRTTLPRLWDRDAAGSNPVTRTIKETSFVYQKDKRGFLVFIGSVWYNHLKKMQTAERLNQKEETHGS